MPDVPVAEMQLQTRDDGVAVLAVRVAQPVERLAASVFVHDSVDVAWRAGLSFTATNDALVWVAGLGPADELPSLLEVGNLNTLGGPTSGPLTPGATRWVFLKPATGEGDWVSGVSAQAELGRIEQLRDQHFTAPLAAPGASPNAARFLILAIADNLLITQPQRVPGISLYPMTSDLGDDVRNVLNRILRERRIITILQGIPKSQWLAQMRSKRPAVLIECHVQAETRDAAAEFGRETMKRLLDMMTLRRGAAARLIAGVMLEHDGSGRPQYHGAWIEHSGYDENLAGGFLSGEDVHALQTSWGGLQANPRAQLWVSLYADAVRDPRWDYQFFRCFNLLEAIAAEVVPRTARVTDEAGNLRPFRNGNGNYTTRQAQGKVYMLLLRLDGTAADDHLWDEVGIWVQIRNDVAHKGAWQQPHAGEEPEHAAAHAAIASSGHDGTFESATKPFVNKIRESVKRTLYAEIHGTL